MTAHGTRQTISPIGIAEDRPTWSVMISSYNCGSFLEKALRSVLDQDPGVDQMQIEVVDDCSNRDRPEELAARIGRGRVGFFRQPQNVGHIRNFNTCLKRARGALVHLLHGDDWVGKGFYAALQRGFESGSTVGAAFCRPVYVDAKGDILSLAPLEASGPGVLPDAVLRLAEEQKIMTPAIAVRRSVYEEVGGFDSRLVCSEDWEMWVRIAARYGVWYEPEPLAFYRMHDNSNTGRHVRTAEDMTCAGLAIDIFKDYLPPESAEAITSKARRIYAKTALANTRRLMREGDAVAAWNQLRAAVHLAPWRFWAGGRNRDLLNRDNLR